MTYNMSYIYNAYFETFFSCHINPQVVTVLTVDHGVEASRTMAVSISRRPVKLKIRLTSFLSTL